jgi:hypothetical protein
MVTVKEQKEKDKLRKDKISGFFLDIAKMTFGATVLGGILPVFTDTTTISIFYLVAGIGATIGFYKVAINILK